MSHADEDHLNGLVPIIEHPRIRVHQIVHNGIATFKPKTFATNLGDLDTTKKFLVTRHSAMGNLNGLAVTDGFAAWKKAIANEGGACSAVDTSSGTLDVGDPQVTVEVLGPRLDSLGGQPCYRWFGDEAHTINGHSVVLRLTYGFISLLLSGDINAKGAAHILEDPGVFPRLGAHVFKAPHHGSHDFHRPFLEAVRPQTSIISSGDMPDHGHPRVVFIGAVGQVSRSSNPLIFSTEIAATFVEDKNATGKEGETENTEEAAFAGLNLGTPAAGAVARQLFKRRLHGMINVRTDGTSLYSARRVAAGYWWEAYGPDTPAP